jgi:peptidoglycan hydrolase-like protein with peptidoglycan-binding domain
VGSRGTAVTALQKNLTELGYNTKGTDGIFGNNTKTAVIEFQKAYGLTADGCCGLATWKKILGVK